MLFSEDGRTIYKYMMLSTEDNITNMLSTDDSITISWAYNAIY